MAQGSARFLLEFQVTGDQEVIGKIREVGRAGTEAASELQQLQGMEDPFAPVAEGAEAAIEPITGVGTAAQETITPLTDMGSATDETVSILSGAGTAAEDFGGSMDAITTGTEAASGGLTDTNTVMGEFGDAASTSADQSASFGETVSGLSGSFVAIGGAIGGAVSAFFRYQDAQLRVQKAQNALARAQEAYRKTTESIQALLATATSNTDAIAAANTRYVAAQAEVNRLLAEGVNSGAEYEAATAELQSAQAALAAEFAKGGGDAAKLTAEMNKAELQAGKMATSTGQLSKTQRQANQVILDSIFSFAALAGSIVQITQGLGKMRGGFTGLTNAMKAIPGVIAGIAAGFAVFIGIMTAIDQNIGGVKDAMKGVHDAANKNIPALQGLFDHLGKTFQTNVQGFGAWGASIQKALGIPVAEAPKAATAINETTTATDTASQAAAANAQAWANMAAMFQKAREQSDLQSAALEKLIGPTTSLNAELTVMTGEINKLTAADVQSVTAIEKQNRAMIVANAGFNNGAVAAIQYQQALTAQTQSLVDDTDKKNANAQATLTLADSSLNARNAIATVNEEWANSVDRLTDLDAVMSNQEARYHAIMTVANEFTASLIEESIELDGTIMAMSEKENALRAVENAYKQGIVSIDEWVTGLATAAAEEQSAIDRLADFGVAFSDLPGYMAPTIENLQLFAEAAAGSGEAAQEMADMASEAFQTMASDGQKLIDGLSDVILEGGKDMEDNWQKAWEKMPQAVRDSMSDAQMEEMKAIAQMQAAAEAAVIELGIDLKTEDFAAARADFTANLNELASNSDGIWSEMWSRAAELASTGSEAMVARISEIIKSGDSPEIMLQQLDAAFQKFGPKADAAGTAIKDGILGWVIDANTMVNNAGLNELPPKGAAIGAETGKGMGISLSEEFAAAGTHIASVIEGIKSNIASIGTGVGAGITIPIQVDNSAAISQIDVIKTKLGQLAQTTPPKITIDNSGAIMQIDAVRAKMDALAQSAPPKITVDNSGAISQIDALATKINQLAQSTPPRITVDTSGAISQIDALATKINALAQSRPPSIQVNNAAAIQQIAVVQTQINAIKQKTPPAIKVNNVTALQQIRAVQTAMNNLKQKTPPKITVNNTQALKQIRAVQTGMNNLKSKSINIHVGLSGPGVAYLQHGYHGVVDKPMLFIAGEAGPERVDVTPGRGGHGGSNEIINRTVHVGTSGGGGNRPINITVVGELNGRELIRFTRRGIMEEASGAM